MNGIIIRKIFYNARSVTKKKSFKNCVSVTAKKKLHDFGRQ